MNEYYDGTKLLSLSDQNGKKPEIYICTSNRTGGKTTYFNRLVFNRWKKEKKKFCLLYRWDYELDDVADKFFKDIGGLFFDNYIMSSKKKGKGAYCELYARPKYSEEEYSECCGYAIAINKADVIKKYSHLFSDVDSIIFDEFQSESNHYCNDEIKKFISIHTSIARGQGKQIRHVPVYMISNPVSLINPYYTELGISARLTKETKFLRGDGFVLEQGFIRSASEQQKESGFNRAFAKNEYVAYSAECVYLNDSQTFIETVQGKSKYLCTLKFGGCNYGIREFREKGIIYCDNRPDMSNPNRLSATTDDHNINYVMLKSSDFFITSLRYYYSKGCFRFRDLRCKEAIMKILSY